MPVMQIARNVALIGLNSPTGGSRWRRIDLRHALGAETRLRSPRPHRDRGRSTESATALDPLRFSEQLGKLPKPGCAEGAEAVGTNGSAAFWDFVQRSRDRHGEV